MEAETKQQDEKNVERYPDKNASQIQTAISVLSDMETGLSGIADQVSDMKRKMLNFAETESEKAKADIIEEANREAQEALEQLRKSAQQEADAIVAKGTEDSKELRAKISSRVSGAVDVIVSAVQSV